MKQAKCNLRVNLFSIAHETQMPFELLFKKNLRKRQTDLFLDSWRKVTTKLGLSYQFKCTSKQQFFNLFMDAFQNCIEEIGNESAGVGGGCGGGDVSAVVPTSSSSSSVTVSNHDLNSTVLAEGGEAMETTSESASASVLVSSSSYVQHFRAKMANSFEQCKLWPVSDDEYAELLEEARKKTAATNQLVASSSNTRVAESPASTTTNQPPKKGSTSSSTPPVNRSAVVMSAVAAAVPKSAVTTKTPSLKREQTIEDANDDDASASFKSADEMAIIKSLADLINHDREMQKIVKDMIRDELGKLIRFVLI